MFSFAFTAPNSAVVPCGSSFKFRGRNVCGQKRLGNPKGVVRAVLDSRVSAGFGVGTQQKRMHKVRVFQRDRSTIVEVDSDTNLRRALLDAKVDLYTLGGKLRNCGGAGQCGTCLINVKEGIYNTNGRTPREEFLLEDQPNTWRLACRTLVHGDVTVQTKPQA